MSSPFENIHSPLRKGPPPHKKLSNEELLKKVMTLAMVEDSGDALKRAIDIASNLMNSNDVTLWVIDTEQPHKLKCRASHKTVAKYTSRDYSLKKSGGKYHSLTSWVFNKGKPLCLKNVHDRKERSRKCPDAVWTYNRTDNSPNNVRPTMLVPLNSVADPKKKIGVIRIGSRNIQSPFSNTDQQLLEAFSEYLSFVLGLLDVRQLLPTPHLGLIERYKQPLKKDITVLYLDLAGFTTFAEQILESNAEQIVETLNCFFNIAVPVVYKFHGTIDKFVGDGLIAIFNAYTDCEEHSLKAVKCALEIRKCFNIFKSKFVKMLFDEFDRKIDKKHFSLGLKIGVTTGAVTVGAMGATKFEDSDGHTKRRVDFTVIGQVVNLGARLISDVPQELKGRNHSDFSKTPLILVTSETRKGLNEMFKDEKHLVSIRGAGPEGVEERNVYEIKALKRGFSK